MCFLTAVFSGSDGSQGFTWGWVFGFMFMMIDSAARSPWPRMSHIGTSLTKNSSTPVKSILFLRFSDSCWFQYLAEERASYFKVFDIVFPSAENNDGFSFMFWPLLCNDFPQLGLLSGRSAGGTRSYDSASLRLPQLFSTSKSMSASKVNRKWLLQ